MKRKWKVTGKFCLLGINGKILKESIFLNKIVMASTPKNAFNDAKSSLSAVFVKKYNQEVTLRQLSKFVKVIRQ